MADERANRLWAMLNPDPRRRQEELARWSRLHQADSDRALLLAAAGAIEDRLGRVLRRAFVLQSAEVEDLLGGEDGAERPLAGLGARATLCLALGLISRAAASQAHLFRRLRARALHRPEGVTFDGDAKVRALVTGLRWMSGEGMAVPSTDRERVLHAAVDLLLYLEAIERTVRPLEYWPLAYDSAFMDEATRAREVERVMKMQQSREAPARLWF